MMDAYLKKGKEVNSVSENKITCFVIMPFSQTTLEHTKEYWDEQYDSFLKPLIEENSKVIAYRSEAERGDVVKQIITDLVVSPIVVADITDKNANVFWELGVRQSFKHGTITIAEYGTILPFDIIGKGTLYYYPNDHIKNMKFFTTQFKNAINDCLLYPDKQDSKVLESITGRGTLFETFLRDETNRRLDAVLYECDMNLRSIKVIIKTAEENLKKRDIRSRGSHPFIHLSSRTIEFLVISRYINIPNNIYEIIASQLSIIDSINANLIQWANIFDGNTDQMNNQLILSNKNIAQGMELLKSEIIAYRNNNKNLV